MAIDLASACPQVPLRSHLTRVRCSTSLGFVAGEKLPLLPHGQSIAVHPATGSRQSSCVEVKSTIVPPEPTCAQPRSARSLHVEGDSWISLGPHVKFLGFGCNAFRETRYLAFGTEALCMPLEFSRPTTKTARKASAGMIREQTPNYCN